MKAVACLAAVLGTAMPAYAQVSPKPQQMDVITLDGVHDSLAGRMVAVTGSAMCQTSSLCLLFPDKGIGAVKVAFNPAALSSTERSQLAGCNPTVSPCHLTVEGRVRAWSSGFIDATTLYRSTAP